MNDKINTEMKKKKKNLPMNEQEVEKIAKAIQKKSKDKLKIKKKRPKS